uniref:Uncharacterized protein n=1 Tax=Chelonoidis abingdonii TaxID=106734 RepID=A0A8C0IWP5_CHEAB
MGRGKSPPTSCGCIRQAIILNYGGVYVGLPSEAATMAPSQTKTEPKGTCRLKNITTA